MIRVEIERNRTDSHITRFQVRGHAGYAEAGHDIVCAGVSAVTVGTVNSLESLLSVTMAARMEKGDLTAELPSTLAPDILEQSQLILESMVVMLRSIEESYGDHVTVRETTKD